MGVRKTRNNVSVPIDDRKAFPLIFDNKRDITDKAIAQVKLTGNGELTVFRNVSLRCIQPN